MTIIAMLVITVVGYKPAIVFFALGGFGWLINGIIYFRNPNVFLAALSPPSIIVGLATLRKELRVALQAFSKKSANARSNCHIRWTSVSTGKKQDSDDLSLESVEKLVSDFDARVPDATKADKHEIICNK
jgi:hypothetical protein